MTDKNLVIKTDLDYNVFYDKTNGDKKVISVRPLSTDFVPFEYEEETAKGYKPIFVEKEFVNPETKEVKKQLTLDKFLKEEEEEEEEFPTFIPVSTSYHITSKDQVQSNSYGNPIYGIYRGTMKLRLRTQDLPLDVVQQVHTTITDKVKDGYELIRISSNYSDGTIYKLYMESSDEKEAIGADPHWLNTYEYYIGHNTPTYDLRIEEGEGGLHRLVVDITLPEATFADYHDNGMYMTMLINAGESQVEFSGKINSIPYKNGTTTDEPSDYHNTLPSKKEYLYSHIETTTEINTEFGVENVHNRYTFYSKPSYNGNTISSVTRVVTAEQGIV